MFPPDAQRGSSPTVMEGCDVRDTESMINWNSADPILKALAKQVRHLNKEGSAIAAEAWLKSA